MKHSKYEAILLEYKTSPPEVQSKPQVKQASIKQQSNTDIQKQTKLSQSTRIISNILLRLINKRKNNVLMRIRNKQNKIVNLEIINLLYKRLIAEVFLKILKSNALPDQISIKDNKVKPKSNLLVYQLEKYGDNIKRIAISRIKCFALQRINLESSINSIISIFERMADNVVNTSWNQIKVYSQHQKYRSKYCRDFCRILPNIVNKIKFSTFKCLVAESELYEFYETIDQKAKIIKNSTQLHSNRNKYINIAKHQLKQAKQILQAESSLKHKSSTEIKRFINAKRNQIKDILKQYDKKQIKCSEKEQLLKSYFEEAKVGLKSKTQFVFKSKMKKNKVIEIYQNIDQSTQQQSLQKYIVAARSIESQNEFYLYQNIKLRNLLMLYEKNHRNLVKVAEDEKVIRQNNSLKALIQNLLYQQEQKEWARRVSKNS